MAFMVADAPGAASPEVIPAPAILGGMPETEEDKEFAAEFKMLFPQTTLLIRQEQDDVKKLYTLLSASPGWPTKTAESHLREIREAAREAVKTLGGA